MLRAADHFNAGHPHSHVVVRGKDEQGKDLVIARDYIAHGIRARASELITRELGPESELDTLRKLEQEVSAERFTRLDRAMLRDALPATADFTGLATALGSGSRRLQRRRYADPSSSSSSCVGRRSRSLLFPTKIEVT